MSRIDASALRNWNQGDTMNESDYEQEREIIRVAVNDNYSRILDRYTKAEIDNFLNAMKGSGWTNAITVKSNYDLIQTILGNRYTKTEVDAFITNLQSQVSSNDVDITNLQNVDTALQGQITSIKSDIVSLRNKDEDLQHQNDNGDAALIVHKTGDDHDSRYYVKSEINSSLNLKADKATTYTKTEVDTNIQSKYDQTSQDIVEQVQVIHDEVSENMRQWTPNNLGRIHNFTKTVTLGSVSNKVLIDIPEYNATTDFLIVSQNGMSIYKDKNYTISYESDGKYYINKIEGSWQLPTTLEITALKAADVDWQYKDARVVLDTDGVNISDKLGSLSGNVEEVKRALNYYWLPEKQPSARTNESNYFVDAYQITPDQAINNFFEPLRIADPSYITRDNLGKDASGVFDIWKYEFTPKDYKNTIILTSVTHGSEVTMLLSMIRFLHYLTNEWEKYPELAYIRQNIRIIYVPIVNPWGMAQNPRKRQNSNGVDLNRNFDYKWAEYTSANQVPFGHDYKGTAPFSEVESRHIKTLLESYPDAVAYLDLHNTGAALFNFYVSLPENYPYKTFDKLIDYFSRNMVNPTISLPKLGHPQGVNYAYHVLKMPASTPEWCDTNYGLAYSSAEITKAVEWLANVIIEHCRTFGMYVAKPFVAERYFTQSGTAITIGTGTGTATHIPSFREAFPIPADGIITFEGYTVVQAGADATRAFIIPAVGQTGSTPTFGTYDSTRWESYVDLAAGQRLVVPFQASMPVKKTNNADVLTLGIDLYGKTGGTGQFTITRYRGRLTYIPTNVDQFSVKQITI